MLQNCSVDRKRCNVRMVNTSICIKAHWRARLCNQRWIYLNLAMRRLLLTERAPSYPLLLLYLPASDRYYGNTPGGHKGNSQIHGQDSGVGSKPGYGFHILTNPGSTYGPSAIAAERGVGFICCSNNIHVGPCVGGICDTWSGGSAPSNDYCTYTDSRSCNFDSAFQVWIH
jgi:hypothetical protein